MPSGEQLRRLDDAAASTQRASDPDVSIRESRPSRTGPPPSREDRSPFQPSQVSRSAGKVGTAAHAGDTHEVFRAADSSKEAHESYNQQEVVSTYVARLEPELAGMAQKFQEMGQKDLQWQTELIISMLPLLYDDHGLAFPLYVEVKDLQNKMIERRDLEAVQLERGDEGDAPISGEFADKTAVSAPGARRKAWDRLLETMSKVNPDILKLIAHLRTVREWSATGEVSANALFVKGKMSLTITFGE